MISDGVTVSCIFHTHAFSNALAIVYYSYSILYQWLDELINPNFYFFLAGTSVSYTVITWLKWAGDVILEKLLWVVTEKGFDKWLGFLCICVCFDRRQETSEKINANSPVTELLFKCQLVWCCYKFAFEHFVWYGWFWCLWPWVVTVNFYAFKFMRTNGPLIFFFFFFFLFINQSSIWLGSK